MSESRGIGHGMPCHGRGGVWRAPVNRPWARPVVGCGPGPENGGTREARPQAELVCVCVCVCVCVYLLICDARLHVGL